MEFRKSEAIRECKKLLKLINCEAIIDTKEPALYDMLFQSETKKRMLLSWMIQQIYSSESCSGNTFENLISTFIPKPVINSFLSGTLHPLKQYKLWKLLMETVHRIQKQKVVDRGQHEIPDLENGIVFQKYEDLWNTKSEPITSYVDLVGGKPKKFSTNELKIELEKATTQISSFKSAPGAEIPNIKNSVNINESEMPAKLVECNTRLDEIIKRIGDPKPSNDLAYSKMTYDQLNRQSVQKITTSLHTLSENLEMFEKLMRGVAKTKS